MVVAHGALVGGLGLAGELALGLADRVSCLHNGAKVAEGSPEEIKRDRRVQDVYLGRAEE